MISKLYLLSMILIFTELNCFGQDPGTMVISKTGVFIRDSASVNSKKICSVPFGEIIEFKNAPNFMDTVNGMEGHWWLINYKSCTGYIFDAYLANILKQDKKYLNLPQYFEMEVVCGEDRYFNSNYYWYGIFDQGEKQNISLVEVDFSVKKENWSDGMYDQYLKVGVSSTQSPEFLIGFPDSIPDFEIKKEKFQNGIIYPGQSYFIGHYNGTSYYLAAYGATTENKDGQHFSPPYLGMKNYKLKIIRENSSGTFSQDLWLDVDDQLINESMPAVSFVGDLNNDSVPDLILSHSHRYTEAAMYLFMSGYNKNKILSKVAVNNWGACY